jgi:hypothetical protein
MPQNERQRDCAVESGDSVDSGRNSLDPAVDTLLRVIADLADRASAQFIPDDEKVRNFSAALVESRTRAQAAAVRPILD